MHIYLDLDGPVFDCSRRIYAIYADIAQENGLTPLPFVSFMTIARRGISLDNILARMAQAAGRSQLKGKPSARLESDRYLTFDRLHPGVNEALCALGRCYDLTLLAPRNKMDSLRKQLRHERIDGQITDIIQTARCDADPECLAGCVAAHPHFDPNISWLVGDTTTDIIAGKSLGVRTCAVLNGLGDKDALENLSPNLVVDTIALLPLVWFVGAPTASLSAL